MASRYPLLQDQCKAVLPYKQEQKSRTAGVGIFGHIVIYDYSKNKQFSPQENIKYTVEKKKLSQPSNQISTLSRALCASRGDTLRRIQYHLHNFPTQSVKLESNFEES